MRQTECECKHGQVQSCDSEKKWEEVIKLIGSPIYFSWRIGKYSKEPTNFSSFITMSVLKMRDNLNERRVWVRNSIYQLRQVPGRYGIWRLFSGVDEMMESSALNPSPVRLFFVWIEGSRKPTSIVTVNDKRRRKIENGHKLAKSENLGRMVNSKIPILQGGRLNFIFCLRSQRLAFSVVSDSYWPILINTVSILRSTSSTPGFFRVCGGGEILKLPNSLR